MRGNDGSFGIRKTLIRSRFPANNADLHKRTETRWCPGRTACKAIIITLALRYSLRARQKSREIDETSGAMGNGFSPEGDHVTCHRRRLSYQITPDSTMSPGGSPHTSSLQPHFPAAKWRHTPHQKPRPRGSPAMATSDRILRSSLKSTDGRPVAVIAIHG